LRFCQTTAKIERVFVGWLRKSVNIRESDRTYDCFFHLLGYYTQLQQEIKVVENEAILPTRT
jgi:hypothetical protein